MISIILPTDAAYVTLVEMQTNFRGRENFDERLQKTSKIKTLLKQKLFLFIMFFILLLLVSLGLVFQIFQMIYRNLVTLGLDTV